MVCGAIIVACPATYATFGLWLQGLATYFVNANIRAIKVLNTQARELTLGWSEWTCGFWGMQPRRRVILSLSPGILLRQRIFFIGLCHHCRRRNADDDGVFPTAYFSN